LAVVAHETDLNSRRYVDIGAAVQGCALLPALPQPTTATQPTTVVSSLRQRKMRPDITRTLSTVE